MFQASTERKNYGLSNRAQQPPERSEFPQVRLDDEKRRIQVRVALRCCYGVLLCVAGRRYLDDGD